MAVMSALYAVRHEFARQGLNSSSGSSATSENSTIVYQRPRSGLAPTKAGSAGMRCRRVGRQAKMHAAWLWRCLWVPGAGRYPIAWRGADRQTVGRCCLAVRLSVDLDRAREGQRSVSPKSRHLQSICSLRLNATPGVGLWILPPLDTCLCACFVLFDSGHFA